MRTNPHVTLPPMSPIDSHSGLIRWVFDLPIEPGEPQIFNAAVRMADTTRFMGRPCYDQNGGSGLTRAAARHAAVGEGLERYCASAWDPATLIFGTGRDLSGPHLIYPPERYALFHPDQHLPYPRFTADLPISWIEAYSLTQQQPSLIPASLVYLPYVPQFLEQGEQGVGAAMSTGLACGRSYGDAVLRGIYEVIERDAVMITWLNRLPMPRVDIESSPTLYSLYEARFARDGLDYRLYEITTDIPVPSYLCLLIDKRTEPAMICAGGATSLDPIRAASKAMIEAIQTREWGKVLPSSPAPDLRKDYTTVRDFEDHVVLYAHGDMFHSLDFLPEACRSSSTTSWRNKGTANTDRDLDWVLDVLRSLDVDVLVTDLTTPDVAACGYRVVKVLMPELQPLYADYRERFLGGTRLYEVPRRLGLRTDDSSLSDLNPDPHPYP